MQGSAPMHSGQGPGLSLRDLGEASGEQNLTLIQTEMPAHTHQVSADSGNGNQTSPVANPNTSPNVWSSLAGRTPPPLYATSSNTTMSLQAISITGGGLPHNNMPPFLVLNFVIAMQGVYPARP
jgi:microcystin-dependent protein